MLSPQALRCHCHCHFFTLLGPKLSLTPPEAAPPTNRGDGQNFSCIQNVSQHGLNATPPCTHQCNRSMLGSQKLSRNTMAMLKGMQSHSFRFILSLRLWSNAIVILKPMENVHRGLLVRRRRPPSSHPTLFFLLSNYIPSPCPPCKPRWQPDTHFSLPQVLYVHHPMLLLLSVSTLRHRRLTARRRLRRRRI